MLGKGLRFDQESDLLLGRQLRIPAEILQAQRDGRLVLFVGAGVSKAKPSCLPGFRCLAHQLAGRDISEDLKSLGDRIDRFLGLLEDQDIPIRHRVQEILGRADSLPTELHRSLVQLFPDPPTLRIVTTNQDRHFSTVLEDLRPTDAIETYRSPALPLGDSFSGLVYLHGSVDGPLEEMILTDQDFAKAYMTSAYAARFLERMFPTYAVLFVGYSHSDLVMQYFSRGLSGRCARYALVSEDEVDTWSDLGIEAVPYAVGTGEDKHEELHTGLALWAEYTKETPSERERHIQSIVGIHAQKTRAADSTLSLHQSIDQTSLSYIDWQLSDEVGAHLFSRHAEGLFWLNHVKKHKDFKALFSPSLDLSKRHFSIAEWFAIHFVTDPDAASAGLAVVEQLGGQMHAALWHRIAREVAWTTERTPSEHLSKWLIVLLAAWRPDFNCQPLSDLLDCCLLPQEKDSVLIAFEFLTRPRVALRQGYSFADDSDRAGVPPSMEISIRGDLHALTRFIEKRVCGSEEGLCRELLPIVEKHLVSAHWLLVAAGEASCTHDPISFSRNTIPPSDQNLSPVEMDVLIDAARILLEWAGTQVPEWLGCLIQSWIASPVPMLRRLAVFAMSSRSDLSADEKVDWLLQRDLLLSPVERAETFDLLEQALCQSSQPLKKRVAEYAIRQGPLAAGPSAKREISDYERYNLLVWLSECDPEATAVAEALAEQKRQHPEFRRREHPELTHWSSFGYRPAPREDQINALLSAEPSEVVASLIRVGGPSEYEIDDTLDLHILEAAAKESVAGGIRIATQLACDENWDTEIWEYLLNGLKQAEKDAGQWKELVLFLSGLDELRKKSALSVARLLRDGVRSGSKGIPLDIYPVVLGLAMNLWRDHLGEGSKEGMNFVTTAINQPGGVTAEIVVLQLANLRKAQKTWGYLPDEYRSALEGFLADERDAALYARVILAGALQVLHDIDPDWTASNVIPLLDWKKGVAYATAAWQGYLVWGQWNDAYLKAVMPFYKDTAHRLEKFGSEQKRQFSLHIASILLMSPTDPYSESWLGEILLSIDEELRADIAGHVSWLLSTMEDVGRRIAVWEERLKPYWRKRLDGPLPKLLGKERKEIVEWLFPLLDCLPSVAEMIEQTEPPTSLNMGYFWRLMKEEQEAIREFPSEIASVSAHIVSQLPTGTPLHRFADLVLKLESEGASPSALQRLRDEAIRLGVDLNRSS